MSRDELKFIVNIRILCRDLDGIPAIEMAYSSTINLSKRGRAATAGTSGVDVDDGCFVGRLIPTFQITFG